MVIKYLIEKEFKQMFRNKFIPKLIIAFPFIALIILPMAANMEVKNVNLVVIDNDHSSFSQQITQRLAANPSMTLYGMCQTYEQALHLVEESKVDVIVIIKNDLEKELSIAMALNGQVSLGKDDAKIFVAANSVNSVKGTMGAMYVVNIISNFLTEQQHNLQQTQSPLEISSFYAFNPRLEYKYFMVPALMVMILTIICGFLPALNIVGEKESGNIEQINVTPVKRFTFILSKLIPYWIVGTIVISIGFFVAWLIYGIVPLGNFLTIYVLSWLFILCVSGMGLLISNYFNTYQKAMFIMFFLLMILLLMSGMFTPFSSMPVWGQYIGRLSPLKYYIESMRAIYLKGSTFLDLMPQICSLITILLVLNTWAIFSYHKKK
ncbi:MAG: ABC transporter permease [Bacteroidales bacterium]|jgi:ABC-2 type transport system permease protein|nr:ABC transporter permease [Bacteroidales bacterium]